MQFELDEDRALLARQTRELLEKEADLATNRRVMESEPAGYAKPLFRKLGELGYPSLLLAEEEGGLGPIAFAAVLHEMGRVALPGPFLELGARAARARGGAQRRGPGAARARGRRRRARGARAQRGARERRPFGQRRDRRRARRPRAGHEALRPLRRRGGCAARGDEQRPRARAAPQGRLERASAAHARSRPALRRDRARRALRVAARGRRRRAPCWPRASASPRSARARSCSG